MTSTDSSSTPDAMNLFAAELADLAAEAALSVAGYLRAAARTIPEYETKKNLHDPVTVHDRAVENSLRNYFSAAVPGSRVLGEEMGEKTLPGTNGSNLGNSVRHLSNRVRWIIDPIDGTANFASGSTYFGTSIAAELDGKIVAGAISIPYTEELFVANLQEAWHIDRHGLRSPLKSVGPTQESQAVISCYYPGNTALTQDPQQALEDLTDLSHSYMAYRRYGAGALDLALVAAGWLGVSMGITYGPWDVAAGIHLVKVAGGNVINLPMRSDLPEGLRPAVLATVGGLEPATAEKILRRLDKKARD